MVYLLHFDRPYKHAKHYLGFVASPELLDKRMEKHKGGTGAKLMDVITKAGIGFSIARLWPDGDRNFERQLKNQKNTPRLCTICNPNAVKGKENEHLSDVTMVRDDATQTTCNPSKDDRPNEPSLCKDGAA